MAKINTDFEKIKELLTRGVEEVIDRDSLEKKLLSGKQLRVKLGIDPTSPNLHLGRSIPLLKLRDFQELGHKVIFIIGDFTGVIGDTSDKESERPMLDNETIKKNMKTYIEQAGKILDIKKCEVYKNSKWLKTLNYNDVGEQANQFSVNEFISRDNIKRRLDAGKRVSLREVLYPLMQGYDSVAIKADVELGGTDQRFNLLAGRELQRADGQNPQDILMSPLVNGLDGRKMSSSWGNTINITDSPQDMFGKIMSLHDDLVVVYFELMTRVDLVKIEEYKQKLKNGENPKNIKIELGKKIVEQYYSREVAEQQAEEFERVFSQKKKPTDMPEFEVKKSKMLLVDILIESGVTSSKSDARRLIEQGAVRLNDEKILDRDAEVVLKNNDIVQAGKRNFRKIKSK